MAFLDINISRSRGGFISSVYRKPTFTGWAYGKLPMQPFHDELQRFQTLLNQNGCPSRYVEKCIRDFLDKAFGPPEKQSTAPKYLLSFLLPFTGNRALQIRQQLIKLMSKVPE